MKRTGFSRPQYEPPPRAPLVRVEGVRATMSVKVRELQPITKEEPVRSEAYRRLIAALPCALCGIHGYTQACHGDQGKGLSLKACDLTCWPGCGPHDGLCGCHYTVGSTGTLTREERRCAEKQFAAQAQQTLIAMAAEDNRIAAVLRKVGLL